MKNSFNDIDNFLRDSFDDFSSEPSPELRNSVSAKVRKFNFFKFNPMSFNIFYLAALIIGTGTIVSFATTGNDTYYAKNIVSPEKNIFEVESLSIQTREVQLASNTFNPHIKTEPINVISPESNNSIPYINSGAETINEKTTTESQTSILEEHDLNNLTSVNKNDITTPIEKIIIFDTIIEEQKSTIIDTINIEVRKTVEIKRKRKSLK